MKQISRKFPTISFKSLVFSSALILIFTQSNAQMCASGTIYALSNSGNIYPVTVSNGSAGSVINSTSLNSTNSANGIGYNTVNGIFYYFQNASNGGSQQFVSYDPSTNVYTTLASAPITSTAFKGCVNFNGTGYYCIDANGNLCYYNISANTWTLISSTFTDQYGNNVTNTLKSEASGDIAIDGLGNMWIVSSSTSKWGLYKLSAPLPTTSAASITLKQLVDPNTSTPGANFAGIAFDPAGNIYMGTNNDLYLLQNNFTLTHLASFSTAGICGDLTSCNFPFSILAVNFESANATAQNNKTVSISWSVSEQKNNKGYYVEQSVDGSSWNELGFVASKAFEGNVEYQFTDNNPQSGINYYRIHAVDLDGAGSYSEIKTASIQNTSNNAIRLWPNPARDAIKIVINNDNSIARIYNQSGSIVSETRLKPGTNTINVSSLSFGAYIVNIKETNGHSYNHKFIKE